MAPELRLPDRAGIADEIAYLRGAYPRSGWPVHRNFGEMSRFWLGVHAELRRHGAQIGEALASFRDGRLDRTGFERFFAPHMSHFLQHLDGHHRIEDAAYFPKFRALDPRMAAGFDLLENDHALIQQQLVASVESARALVGALAADRDIQQRATDAHAGDFQMLRKWLDRHLADEEEIIIPAMLEHTERAVTAN